MNEPQKNQLKTFSVRLDTGLYDKLIAAAGEKGKNEFIKMVLIARLDEPQMNHNEPNTNQERTINEPDKNLIKELELKDKIIEAKDQTIRNLEKDIGYLQLDHGRISGQLDRLLMPSQEEISKKAWWRFWKR
jgi:hypothetical protein